MSRVLYSLLSQCPHLIFDKTSTRPSSLAEMCGNLSVVHDSNSLELAWSNVVPAARRRCLHHNAPRNRIAEDDIRKCAQKPTRPRPLIGKMLLAWPFRSISNHPLLRTTSPRPIVAVPADGSPWATTRFVPDIRSLFAVAEEGTRVVFWCH